MTTQQNDEWPKHPDGRNKKVGEMTPAERDAVMASAVARVAPQFAKAGIAVKYDGVIKVEF